MRAGSSQLSIALTKNKHWRFKSVSHDDIYSYIFFKLFQNLLLQNLSPSKKYAIILGHASCHSRLKHKKPSMSTTKQYIVTFMNDNSLKISDTLPIKLVMLEIIKNSNIQTVHY